MEKGDALLASVHYPSIRDKMSRLQRDYSELCKLAMVRTCGLYREEKVNTLICRRFKY